MPVLLKWIPARHCTAMRQGMVVLTAPAVTRVPMPGCLSFLEGDINDHIPISSVGYGVFDLGTEFIPQI
jgi:hypothetical protein